MRMKPRRLDLLDEQRGWFNQLDNSPMHVLREPDVERMRDRGTNIVRVKRSHRPLANDISSRSAVKSSHSGAERVVAGSVMPVVKESVTQFFEVVAKRRTLLLVL